VSVCRCRQRASRAATFFPEAGTIALNLKHELEALVDALARDGVEFAICGGIAVTIHGAPRFTKDIDLLVPDAQLEAALRVARACGFDLAAAPMVFDGGGPKERHLRRVSKADGQNLLTLDIVLVEPGFVPVWRSRVRVAWEGRVVPVVSIDGLAAMKRRAGRDQDLLDLKNLGVELDEDGPSDERA
jgi:hypothetical protein